MTGRRPADAASAALVLLGPIGAGVRARVDEVAARWPDPHRPVVAVGRPSDLLDPARIVDALTGGLPGLPGSGLTERVARVVVERPLLLALAEAHWADPATLDQLAATLGVAGPHPVTLLVGGVPTRALTEWSDRLVGAGQGEVVRVGPLAADEVAAAVARRTGPDGPDHVAAVIAEVSGGWAGAVEHLVARLDCPPVRSPAERAVLLAVAVLGEPARRVLVERVARAEPATIDRLVATGALDEVAPGHLALATTTAAATLAATPSGARAEAHRRAFRARLDAGDVARAARHGMEGDLLGDADAVAAATGEAAAALARGAVDDAVAWSVGALRLAGAAATAHEHGLHGDAVLAAGRPALAADAYRRAIAARGVSGPAGVDLCRRLARALAYAGDLAGSTAASLDAWARSAAAPELRAGIALEHLHALLQGGGPAAALAQLPAYEGSGDLPATPAVEVAARFLRLHAGGTGTDVDHLVALLATADDPTESSPFDPILCTTQAARLAERYDDDEPVLVAAIAGSEAAGRAHALPTQVISLADSLIRQGRPAEALDRLETMDRAPFPLLAEAVDNAASFALLEQGRPDELAARLDGLPDGGRLWASGLWVGHLRAALALLRGDADAASDGYLAVADAARVLGVGLPEWVPWAEHAVDAHASVGRLDAVEAVCRMLESRTRWPGRWRSIVAARGRAALAVAAGDGDAAESHLAQGAALGGPPLVRARLLLWWAELRRAGGRRADALPLYQEALAAFDVAGAPSDAGRCVAGIRAVGGRRPGRVRSANRLTPQEHRVAALAAAGRLTREIAADLFISRRTVETHLRHVYEKLGVRSKADLVGLPLPPEPRHP